MPAAPPVHPLHGPIRATIVLVGHGIVRRGLINDIDLAEQFAMIQAGDADLKRELAQVKRLNVGHTGKLVEFAQEFRNSIKNEHRQAQPRL